MSAARRLVGVVKITITEAADWQPPGLTTNGHVEVSCEQVEQGVAEEDLVAWASGELGGMVIGEPPPAGEVFASAAAFDWPSVFKAGDVVRSRDGRTIGVVLVVGDSGGGEEPYYELHVDTATDGVPEGVTIWDPWTARVTNDTESLDEARRLGLRGV